MRRRALMVATGVDHSAGGIARANRLVRQSLADFGFQVDVLALNEHPVLKKDGAFPPRDTGSAAGDYAGFNGRKISFSLGVWRRILGSKYALVMCDHINLAAMLAPLQQVGRCSYFVWLYGNEAFPPRPDLEGRLGMQHAQKCLAITEFTRQQVITRYPNLPVEVCELALDPEYYGSYLPDQPPAEQSDVTLAAIDGNEKKLGNQVILFVGRIDSASRYKGQALLLKALPGIQAQFPQVQLVLAGGGDDLPTLLRQAALLPADLHGQIFIPGFLPQEKLRTLYQSCRLFAMPSTGEGFGLVYLEAMASAKPCLAYRESAAMTIVHDGVNGLLVDQPGSIEEIQGKIGRILANPELASKMGQVGYQLVRERYLYPQFQARLYRSLDLKN